MTEQTSRYRLRPRVVEVDASRRAVGVLQASARKGKTVRHNRALPVLRWESGKNGLLLARSNRIPRTHPQSPADENRLWVWHCSRADPIWRSDRDFEVQY